jgi:hypothetical protein
MAFICAMCLDICFKFNFSSVCVVLCCSLSGKQIHHVPTELTNGVQNIVALHDSGQVNPKVRSRAELIIPSYLVF